MGDNGTLVEKRRRELNLTQAELAKDSGVPRSTIAMIETHKLGASYYTAVKLANALFLDWSDIIEDIYSKRSGRNFKN